MHLSGARAVLAETPIMSRMILARVGWGDTFLQDPGRVGWAE